MNNEIKELIAHQVIKTLYSRFESFPENSDQNRNAPFHKAFLNAFQEKLEGHVTSIPYFISLSSWFHGLNTSLGQSFFENVAHILSEGYKKSYTTKANNLLTISSSQKRNVHEIITDLKNGNTKPCLNDENELLFDESFKPDSDANNFTIDVFYENEHEIIAIELKTVRPNAGEMRGEKQKILEAKSALYFEFKDKKINYYIGFPFDPTANSDYDYNKTRFLDYLIDGNKYFDHDEVLLSGELWDFLSNENGTMQQILKIINSIAKPDFLDKYNFINNLNSIKEDSEKYLKILESWYLYSDSHIIRNYSEIEKTIDTNKKIKRIFKQPIFKKEEYNSNRCSSLLNIIKSELK